MYLEIAIGSPSNRGTLIPREKLKESSSFILTLQKDRHLGENTLQRINIRKILDLSEMIRKPYLLVNSSAKGIIPFLSETLNNAVGGIGKK